MTTVFHLNSKEAWSKIVAISDFTILFGGVMHVAVIVGWALNGVSNVTL